MSPVRTPIDGLKRKRGLAGLGLFTENPIRKDTFIIEYTGPLLTQAEADKKRGLYLFAIPESTWTIDGSGRGNLARYINHSCKPNCQVWGEGKHIRIYAKRDIQAGEELTYNYGDDYMEDLDCKCGHCS